MGVLIVIDCLFLFLSSYLKPQIPGLLKHPQHPLSNESRGATGARAAAAAAVFYFLKSR